MADNTATTYDGTNATYDGRNIEELVGFVQEEYPCVYCNVNGTLYAGTDGLCFLGKFFLFDKKIYLKWVDVKVQQTDQGVAIQTRDDEPLIHEFIGIQKPERVWSALVSLHNQALLDRTRSPAHIDGALDASQTPRSTRPRTVSAQPIHRRKQLRRMTSDPNKLAPAIDALFADAGQKKMALDESTKNSAHAAAAATGTTTVEKPVTIETPSKRASLLQIKEDLKSSTNIGVMVEVSPLSEIEAIVGKMQGEFSCVYNRQRGILYAGSTALYFAGERLFFAAKIAIQSSNIRQIQMVKGKPKSDLAGGETQSTEDVIKEQGIVIWTREGISHTFLGMESPDQVWASLIDLRKHASTGPNSPRPFGMRRMNSDPNLQSRTGRQIMSPVGEGGEASKGEVREAEKELAPPVLSNEELKQAWSQVLDKKNRYRTSVVKDHEFACTVDRFFKQYIADAAKFSFEEFMQSKQGDKDLKTSPWKPFEQDGRLVRKRVIRFIHPVNAPMAPPEAQARKEQIYHRFGDHGFTVETKTFVVGVPMTDCFFVKDRVIVAASPAKDKVLLSLEFELEFVKSTMFRGVITKTTNSQISKFCEQMRDYMAESLGEEAVPLKEADHAEKELVAEEPGFSSSLAMTSITHILLLFVILMQLWILMEMRSMKHAMHRIESVEYKPVYYSNQ